MADQLITIFENASLQPKYGYAAELGDGRGVTFGRAGFTSGTSDGLLVVRRYADVAPANNTLARYLPVLRRLAVTAMNKAYGTNITSLEEAQRVMGASLYGEGLLPAAMEAGRPPAELMAPTLDPAGLAGFVPAVQALANNDAFRAVQDKALDDLYYFPSQRAAIRLGLRLLLSKAQLYDTYVQHGEADLASRNYLRSANGIADWTNEHMGGAPVSGVNEVLWLALFLRRRHYILANTDATWSDSVTRVDVFTWLLEAGAAQLDKPVRLAYERCTVAATPGGGQPRGPCTLQQPDAYLIGGVIYGDFLGLAREQAARSQFKAVGDQVNATKAEAMRALLRHFQASLQDFALKHRQDIRRDPVFRAQFHAMCANIGVDPLASNKGTWNKLLGFGDFYYELGVQVVEACITSRAFTGGLVELSAVHKYVQRRRGTAADPVSEDDLLRAIDKLSGLGGGFGVVKIGARQFVRSQPTELSTDGNALIDFAERCGGYFSLQQAAQATGWAEERLREALGAMAREGLLLVDDPPGAGGEAAAAAPLAAGVAAAAAGGGSAPQRLYWVPAVGVMPAIDHYRQHAGLAGVPTVRLADVAAVSLAGAGEDVPPGRPRGEAAVAAVVAGIGGVDLTTGETVERRGS
ncbi:vacuolar sorting-associated 22-like protein 1 [Micractinium conductrix]|uniref:Vacuolar sorting-associated 22-like protein 1 n=1 Tax=Micractinium conductrix TaxID=554055 RepID=A0A2P6V0M4_9CHLO|nr:vacuolar sorting-associated 22-like protein 1 [Micractinium conductrix]|eukprot:PSC67642.1 vacuolar sorting-associated 22-like protein 1 [Micractinium conductrix]